MQLEQLRLRNFRCFEHAELEFDPELNWIVGQNASGKTSLLEALFFLGHGRSFRSSRPDRLLRAGMERFEIVAFLTQDGRRQVLGVAREAGVTEARFGGKPLRSMAAAARALPVLILDSGMSHLINGGPGERRRWLDWGVFHVEHEFLPMWRAYQQALRQRNEALKAGASERSLAPWSSAVASSGESLARLRRGHFDAMTRVLGEYARHALPDIDLDISYRRGWAEDESLAESLVRHAPRDRELGNTRYGPHRAEISLRVNGLPVEERLSRGQQKSLAAALWLAQVKHFTLQTDAQPLLLVDDMAAELDNTHLARFLELLRQQRAQKVLTAIGDSEVAMTGLTDGKVFHVEQGVLTETPMG